MPRSFRISRPLFLAGVGVFLVLLFLALYDRRTTRIVFATYITIAPLVTFYLWWFQVNPKVVLRSLARFLTSLHPWLVLFTVYTAYHLSNWITPIDIPELRLKTSPSIAIIGAGPGGLSTAFFLREHGYQHVDVFEKESRMGGQCYSISHRYRSFDVGANYITPGYPKILELAKKYGSQFYTGPDSSLYNRTLGNFVTRKEWSTREFPLWRVAWAVIRYYVIRCWLSFTTEIDSPGFEYINQDEELMVSFEDWLRNNNLIELKDMFAQPITMMGYGFLKDIPAPYALKYINPRTFLVMAWIGADILPIKFPYRFVNGFQRFWEALAIGLNVKLNTEIKRIVRDHQCVKITYVVKGARNQTEKTEIYDRLILALPLTLAKLKELGLDLTPHEEELFSKVVYNPYTMTTWELDVMKTGKFHPRRVYSMLPYTNLTLGMPWAVVKQWEENPLFQFYTMARPESLEAGIEKVEQDIKLAIRETMGTLKVGASIPEDRSHHTFDMFIYFPHVSVTEMRKGFFRKLEALQGVQNTYFVGGLMAFHLVEPITEYSEHFVKRFFPDTETTL